MKKKPHKRGPGKPHGMNLAEARKWEKETFDGLVRAEAWGLFLNWSDTLQQIVMDSVFMQAEDMYGLDPGHCEEFGGGIMEYRDEITALIDSDYACDKELVYTKEMIDRRLKSICGDKFQPWEVRYQARSPDDNQWPACPACQLVDYHPEYLQQHPDKCRQFCVMCGRPLTEEGTRIFAQRAFEYLKAQR